MAKKLPSPELYDVVEGYIKISVECSEIFALLEEENNSEAEVSHALEFRIGYLFTCILLWGYILF